MSRLSAPQPPAHRHFRRRVRSAGLAAAATSLLALTACGGAGADGGDDVTLNFAFWGDASRADRYEESIDLFEKENPGVTVNTSFASYSDYWTARNTEAAGSSLPDVIQMDIAFLTQYGDSGQIAELDPYVGEQIDLSTFPETLLPAAQVDGKTYGIPTSTNTLATVFNVDTLEELGIAMPEGDLTWDEYHAFLREAAAAGKSASPQVYGSVDYTQIFWLFQIWLGQQGLSMFDHQGALGFTEDDLARWWGQTADLRDEEAVLPAERLAQLTGDSIALGETASEISWDNFLIRFSEGAEGAEMALLPPPADDPDQRGLFLKPSLMLSMSANSDHPEEAAEFIDFLVNDEEVSKIFGTSRGVPASSTQLEALDPEPLDAAILDYEKSIEPYLVSSPPPPAAGFSAMELAFIRIHEDLAYGTVTPDEAAAQWFKEVQAELDS